jgi:hypothetical protein
MVIIWCFSSEKKTYIEIAFAGFDRYKTCLNILESQPLSTSNVVPATALRQDFPAVAVAATHLSIYRIKDQP